MARALVIEEESGTTRATRHPHNGYYAGNFSSELGSEPTAAPALVFDMGQVRSEGATSVRQIVGWAA